MVTTRVEEEHEKNLVKKKNSIYLKTCYNLIFQPLSVPSYDAYI